MLRLERQRAPRDLPARTVAWPVTVFRVRARIQATTEIDPFKRLILDMAHANEDDPARIAALSGLPVGLVRLLMAELNSLGWLDGHARLTAAGQRRRIEVPDVTVVLGWMLRDDLTGQPLPWLGRGAPRHTARPEDIRSLEPGPARTPTASSGLPVAMIDACRLHHRLERLAREARSGQPLGWEPDEGTMAAAEAERRAHPQNVELLDQGDFTDLAVDLWVPIQERAATVQVGCPFGRPQDGRRYLQRLLQVPQADDLLRELNREAERARQTMLADQADQALQDTLRARLAEVCDGRALPAHVRQRLEDAEWLALRAELGRLGPEAALRSFGVLAEELLLELRPPPGARPDTGTAQAFLVHLPAGVEEATEVQALADRIALLVPADDEGRGLELPAFLHSAAVRFVAALRKGRWLDWSRVGVERQIIPFAAAAIQPESADGRRVRAALARDRDLWRLICRAIGLRNPVSHGQGAGAPTRDKHLRDLDLSIAAVHDAIAAVFPKGEHPEHEEEGAHG